MITHILLFLYVFGIHGTDGASDKYTKTLKSRERLYQQDSCPGFCGRVYLGGSNGSVFSSCQACPWGYRSLSGGLCVECADDLPIYDWLYLLFVAILPLLAHSFFVRFYARPGCNSQLNELLEHACCLLECVVAALGTIVLMPPRWSFSLKGCRKSSIKEWYPAFHNPQINFGRTLPCTYEVVFPLYSLPFVYFLFCLMTLIVFRSALYLTIRRKDRNCRAYFAALYCLPLLALIHAFMAGILYHTFAFVLVLFSVGANAFHLALEGNSGLRKMLKLLFTSPRHLTLLFVHMLLLGFAICSLAVDRGDTWAFSALLLVPVPTAFYLLSIGLSHPSTVYAT